MRSAFLTAAAAVVTALLAFLGGADAQACPAMWASGLGWRSRIGQQRWRSKGESAAAVILFLVRPTERVKDPPKMVGRGRTCSRVRTQTE